MTQNLGAWAQAHFQGVDWMVITFVPFLLSCGAAKWHTAMPFESFAKGLIFTPIPDTQNANIVSKERVSRECLYPFDALDGQVCFDRGEVGFSDHV